MSGDVSRSDTWVAERAGPTQWKGRQRAPGGIMIYSRGRGHFTFRRVSTTKRLSGDAFIQLNGTHPSPPTLLILTFCHCSRMYRGYSRRIIACHCQTVGSATTFQSWLCSRHVIIIIFPHVVFTSVEGKKKKSEKENLKV